MYGRILLTNDGSDLAAAAVPRAAAFARAFGSEVLVLRVSRSAGESVDSLSDETWTRQIALGGREVPADERAEAYPPLSMTTAALRDAGVASVGSLVVQGEPDEAIIETAARLRADLIVMSSHGISGFRRAVLGSVTDHVIRHSRAIPVLLSRPLREGTDGSFETLLVALDGSEFSDALVPYADAIASATGAEVVLMRVIDEEVGAEAHLDASSERLRATGIDTVRQEVREGDPGEALVATSEELDADLVLLATHGRGGLGRALLGSVTDHVSRNLSSAAALIVPAERT
jgi:nucleotide-binding universal stress UspA family protein